MNEDRIKELVAAAKLALADDGGLRYEGEDDDCGSHACCGVVSYKDHAEDCWVPRLAAAVSAMEAAA